MLQNPHDYPWRHVPSPASCSFTGAGVPGQALLGVGGGAGAGVATNRGGAHWRRSTGSQLRDDACRRSDGIFPNGLNAPDQLQSSRWNRSYLRRCGAGTLAQAHRPRWCQGPSPDQHVLPFNPVVEAILACPPSGRLTVLQWRVNSEE